MDEQEVRRVIEEEMAKTPDNVGVGIHQAYERLGQTVMARTAFPKIPEQSRRDLLLRINQGYSMLSILGGAMLGKQDREFVTIGNWLEKVPTVYEIAIDVVKYIIEHYDDPGSEWLMEAGGKDEFLGLIGDLKATLTKTKMLLAMGVIPLRSGALEMMNILFSMGYHVILGSELFDAVSGEINAANAILRQYQAAAKIKNAN